jgi:hypothetical protein
MKSPFATLTEMTTIGWSMFLGNQPAPSALTPAGKAAKLAPVQEWEDEGGNVKEVPTPRARSMAAPAKKAAKAKKRKPARTAKGRKRK